MTSNIAIVVLDSLRYDSFTETFDWLPGKWFTNAYSTSHWTVPAHASLYTGYYPSEINVHSKSLTLDCSQPTLAEILHDVGYTTRCFSANANIVHWDGWERGFDEFFGPTTIDPQSENFVNWPSFVRGLEVDGAQKFLHCIRHCLLADVPTFPALQEGYRYWRQSSADGGTKSITKRVKNTAFNTDEFLVINLMETHTPYYSPDGNGSVDVVISDAFADDVTDEEYIRSAYGKSVQYLSDSYRELFDELSEEFDYVITLGDHGELLGEHGMWNHGYGLYPELTRIPLVISGPHVEDSVYEKPVNILDVHETIADLAELDVNSRGRNLLDSPEPRDVLTEFHGFLPWHKEQFERKGVPESVFHERDTILRGVVTPEGHYSYETHSEGVQTSDSKSPEEAVLKIEKRVQELDCKPITESDVEVNEEVKEQLRDLGYA